MNVRTHVQKDGKFRINEMDDAVEFLVSVCVCRRKTCVCRRQTCVYVCVHIYLHVHIVYIGIWIYVDVR